MDTFDDLLNINIILTCALIVMSVYYYGIKTHNHFKNRGMKYLKPTPFFGNTKDFTLGKQHYATCLTELYRQLEGEKCGGIFLNREPVLMLRDPELIKNILIKDFQHFFNRGAVTTDENIDPLTANLANLQGPKWKLLRQKLGPAFSLTKLKAMMEQFNECVDELLYHLKEIIGINKQSLDIKDTMAKLTTDTIGLTAFGLKLDSLKGSESGLRKLVPKIYKKTLQINLRVLLNVLNVRLPRLLKVKLISKEEDNFFINLVRQVTDCRDKEKAKRNDFMQILIDLKNKGTKNSTQNNYEYEQNHLSNVTESNHEIMTNENSGSQNSNELILDEKYIAANTFFFFMAGFETTAATLTFCMLELAANIDVQTNLRNEIITIYKSSGSEITYESIKEMTYMDGVISETLRKYPPLVSLIRRCTAPYKVPDTPIYIKEGERVEIPIYAIHHDSKYYPEPERFDPERFNAENRAKRPYGVYLPFGGGPRMCIGTRFAMTEMKVALAKLIPKYKLTLSSRTQLPLKWKRTWKGSRFLLNAKQEVWVDLTPIKQKFTANSE